ncbi:MAG: CDP-glucose 4,6-dehydratase [Bacteriovorax sp.]|nr:CDP-glucose 4,6-dehydratase [Bacteriovorax sp.]
MTHEIYKNKKVFLTGHTGFKGSWLALWLQELGAEVVGYSLAPEQLSHFNLLDLKMKNYFNNINDQVTLEKAMMEFKPDIVFHLAAQPLVRDSYDDPITTYETNVLGSLKVYMAALKANVGAIVSITTDKVYENKEWLWGYRENDQLGGHDPYSSSKACVELMTSSFRKSFLSDHKMLLATARAGNVIGGGDWAKDRLIPDLVKNANANKTTPIRNPHSVRPWQHVLEPLHGYLLLGEKLLKNDKTFSESFNFGPHMTHNLSVGEVWKIAKEHWDKINIQVTENPEDTKKHEAGLLKLDIEKAIKYLNWNPTFTANESIELTTNWYKAFYLQKSVSTKDDLKKMISRIKA